MQLQSSEDIKNALDKAASSPDPAVRAMALAYKEIEGRLESLRAFFNFYAEGTTAKSSPIAGGPAQAARQKPPKAPRAGKSVKAEVFTEAILTILHNSSEPVKLPDLQTAYEATGLEPPMQPESFRQRMHKRQKEGAVVLIPRVGFWPPEVRADA